MFMAFLTESLVDDIPNTKQLTQDIKQCMCDTRLTISSTSLPFEKKFQKGIKENSKAKKA